MFLQMQTTITLSRRRLMPFQKTFCYQDDASTTSHERILHLNYTLVAVSDTVKLASKRSNKVSKLKDLLHDLTIVDEEPLILYNWDRAYPARLIQLTYNWFNNQGKEHTTSFNWAIANTRINRRASLSSVTSTSSTHTIVVQLNKTNLLRCRGD